MSSNSKNQNKKPSFMFIPDFDLTVKKEDKKKFSFSNYSNEFDQHINESIRGYSLLRDDIVSISRYFVEDNTNVVDIGCSQGTLLKRIKDTNTHVSNTKYIGIDIDVSFKKHWKPEENLEYIIDDVRSWNSINNLSLAISLFTFQFIPERDRLSLMKKIYDNLVEGGAFVFSEKVFSMNSKIQNMMDFLYYDYKRKKFSDKHILDKEQELRHLAKLTNEELLISQLTSIGFEGIQVFWRNFNFIGVIAMKLPKNNTGLDNGK